MPEWAGDGVGQGPKGDDMSEDMRQMLRLAIEPYSLISDSQIFVGDLPADRLSNAKSSILDSIREGEEVIAFVDNRVRLNGRKAILMTDRACHHNTDDSVESFEYETVIKYVAVREFPNYHLSVNLANNRTTTLKFVDRRAQAAIEIFLNGLTSCSIPELVRRVLSSIPKRVFLDNVPSKKLTNAKSRYASRMDTDEKPLALFDLTLFGSGKEGVLLTDRGCYYSTNIAGEGAFQYVDLTITDAKASPGTAVVAKTGEETVHAIKVPGKIEMYALDTLISSLSIRNAFSQGK